jgi:hypothetical protein
MPIGVPAPDSGEVIGIEVEIGDFEPEPIPPVDPPVDPPL